jgi:RND family efflux transporter MFP subunit
MKSWKRVLLQLLLMVLVLATAVGIFKAMSAARKQPERKERDVVAPLLNAITVSFKPMDMVVEGYGSVRARKEVQVVSQVSGKIVQRHTNLVDGGFFAAAEPLVGIEKRDYEIAVQIAQAAVAQAQVALEREQAEAKIARDQWEKLNPGQTPDSILVFHEPQIRSAQAQLSSAQAQLEKAELDLERTQVSMPFAGRILSTSVEIGQFLISGQALALVYPTDRVEIEIPLENSELEWFDVPLRGGEGAEVNLRGSFAGREHLWQGRVVRTKGRIDARSRMVHVVVQVDEPFAVTDARPALVPGMFVRAEILGKTLASVAAVPRHALRQGSEVWVAQAGCLQTKPVRIVRMGRDNVYISAGLNNDDVVITSALDIVTKGMKIRVRLSNSTNSGE